LTFTADNFQPAKFQTVIRSPLGCIQYFPNAL